jgi:hypothetical protein
VLIMISASNSSGFVISQVGLLDSATGKLHKTAALHVSGHAACLLREPSGA